MIKDAKLTPFIVLTPLINYSDVRMGDKLTEKKITYLHDEGAAQPTVTKT